MVGPTLWQLMSGFSITFLTSLFVNYHCLLELPWMKNSLGNKDLWIFLSLPSWPRNTICPSDTYVISDTLRLSNITSDSFHSPRHNTKKENSSNLPDVKFFPIKFSAKQTTAASMFHQTRKPCRQNQGLIFKRASMINSSVYLSV